MKGHAALKFINNDVIRHHDVSLKTSSYANSADLAQPYSEQNPDR